MKRLLVMAFFATAECLAAAVAEAKQAAAITAWNQTELPDDSTLGPCLRRELAALQIQTPGPKKQEVFNSCIELMGSDMNVHDSYTGDGK